jgi:hypothetical protein
MTLSGILNGLIKPFRGLSLNITKRQLINAVEEYTEGLNIRLAYNPDDFFQIHCGKHRPSKDYENTMFKLHKDSNLPALLTVAIINQSTGGQWDNIESLGERLTDQQKVKLKKLAKSKKFKTLKQRAVLFKELGSRHATLDDLVDDVCALDKSRIALLANIHSGVDDALEYCINAPKAEIEILQNIDSTKRGFVLNDIRGLPEYLLPTAKFAIETTINKDDAHWFFGNRPEQTLRRLAALTQEDQKAYLISANTTNAGVILRTFGGLPNKEFNVFMTRFKNNPEFTLSTKVEPYFKKFIHKYSQLPDESQKKLFKELSSEDVSTRHCLMALVNRYGYDSTTYHAGMQINNIPISIPIKEIVLDNEILTARMLKLPRENREAYIIFTDWLGHREMEQMSAGEFALVNQVYDFAKENNEALKFKSGLHIAVARKNLRTWAKTIIKYHQENAFGGDQYKRRGVIAA